MKNTLNQAVQKQDWNGNLKICMPLKEKSFVESDVSLILTRKNPYDDIVCYAVYYPASKDVFFQKNECLNKEKEYFY